MCVLLCIICGVHFCVLLWPSRAGTSSPGMSSRTENVKLSLEGGTAGSIGRTWEQMLPGNKLEVVNDGCAGDERRD